MGKGLKKETLTTRAWHTVDVGLCLYSIKKEPSRLNATRLAWALVGLFGNMVIGVIKRG